MRLPLTPTLLGLVAAAAFTATPVQAFTVENTDSNGSYSIPKFNLEEQAKQFSNGSRESALAPGKTDNSIPLGNGGVMYFGVQQGPTYGSGLNFGPNSFSAQTQNSRQEFNRLTAPPNSLESMR